MNLRQEVQERLREMEKILESIEVVGGVTEDAETR